MPRILLVIVALTCASPLAAQSLSCTALDLGTSTYTSCSNGTRANTQRIGSDTYSTYSDGTRANTQRLGSTTYYRDSRGNSGTSQDLGSFTYTTITGPDGTLRGSSQRLGNTTYGSYSRTEPLGASRRASELLLPPLLPIPE
jgi:hypothetical protein